MFLIISDSPAAENSENISKFVTVKKFQEQ